MREPLHWCFDAVVHQTVQVFKINFFSEVFNLSEVKSKHLNAALLSGHFSFICIN